MSGMLPVEVTNGDMTMEEYVQYEQEVLEPRQDAHRRDVQHEKKPMDTVGEHEELEDTIYAREIRDREEIFNACPIDIVSVSINDRYGVGSKLNSYGEARAGTRRSAETVYVDSSYTSYGTNTEVLKAAHKIDADCVFTEDPTGACVEDMSEWTAEDQAEITLDMWEMVQSGPEVIENKTIHPERAWDGAIYPVLHAPYVEYVDAMRNYPVDNQLKWLESEHPAFDKRTLTLDLIELTGHVAIGGLRDVSCVEERIQIIKDVYRTVPSGVRIHALSPGTEIEMIQFLRNNSHMIDSLDFSTPESGPKNHKMPDATWNQHRHLFPRGTDITTLRAGMGNYIMLQMAYMLGPKMNEATFDEWKEDVRDRFDPVKQIRSVKNKVQDDELRDMLRDVWRRAKEKEDAGTLQWPTDMPVEPPVVEPPVDADSTPGVVADD